MPPRRGSGMLARRDEGIPPYAAASYGYRFAKLFKKKSIHKRENRYQKVYFLIPVFCYPSVAIIAHALLKSNTIFETFYKL